MRKALPGFFVAALMMAGPVRAQGTDVPASALSAVGFRKEFLDGLEDVEKKLTSLAEAVPAAKYGWRPAKGVRSVGEAYMHIAFGNYLIPKFMGFDVPSDIDLTPEFEKEKDKAKVVEALKRSIEFVRQGIKHRTDADMDANIKLFGKDTSVRAGFNIVMNHMHEHLGQSIAYARMNGVVPPWSKDEGAPAPKKEAPAKKAPAKKPAAKKAG